MLDEYENEYEMNMKWIWNEYTEYTDGSQRAKIAQNKIHSI